MPRPYKIGALLAIAAYFAVLSSPIWSLGYPIPQPKPCQVYWDSKAVGKAVSKYPGMIRYSAGPHQALVMIKPPKGMEPMAPFVIRFFHDAKGCFAEQRLMSRAALPYALLLASRQGDA